MKLGSKVKEPFFRVKGQNKEGSLLLLLFRITANSNLSSQGAKKEESPESTAAGMVVVISPEVLLTSRRLKDPNLPLREFDKS